MPVCVPGDGFLKNRIDQLSPELGRGASAAPVEKAALNCLKFRHLSLETWVYTFSMTSLSQSEAIESLYAGKLRRDQGYCEIPTALFVDKTDVQLPVLPDPAFYIRKGESFEMMKPEKGSCSFLILSTHPTVWVKEPDLGSIEDFADKLVRKTSTDTSIPPQKRVEMLQKTAMRTVENLFDSPSPENIKKSEKVVGSFVYLLMKEPKSYLLLSQLSSHDPYTLRHSVGTSVNAIILGKKLGMTDERELTELGLAGLLHDIGKVKVKREIINKNGPLDELEWEEMRQHAQAGYDILKGNSSVSDRVKRAVWEHHEDKLGTGYPQKIPLEKTDLFSRIVSISDIFNALTTDRTYSKARSPFDAFHLMKDKLNHKFDEKLFKELVRIYGGDV